MVLNASYATRNTPRESRWIDRNLNLCGKLASRRKHKVNLLSPKHKIILLQVVCVEIIFKKYMPGFRTRNDWPNGDVWLLLLTVNKESLIFLSYQHLAKRSSVMNQQLPRHLKWFWPCCPPWTVIKLLPIKYSKRVLTHKIWKVWRTLRYVTMMSVPL